MSKKLIEINAQKKELAFLVVVDLKEQPSNHFTPQEEHQELESLVESSGCQIVGSILVHLGKISPSLFIGRGKADQIHELAWRKGAKVIIFNIDLSSSQQRNLEDITGIKTIDRTQLILDIFAQHAKSNAGKIQVELAQLEYLLPRLKGKGIMLSRLGGGIGTRGPGEKKLEIERRRIGDRINKLKKELQQLRKHRDLLRRKRKKEGFFLASLVGYTNAGKTTLLNILTDSRQKVEEALFTTLDPLSRVFNLKQKVIIADTVGFIHHLPQKLLQAFKATLEELEYADLLIHIIDVSRPNFKKLIASVERILKELHLEDKPILYVFNKIDKIDNNSLESIKNKNGDVLFISARKGTGLYELKMKIDEKISENFLELKVSISYQNKEALNFIYKHAQILDTHDGSSENIRFTIRIRKEDSQPLKALISS